jgi:DNA ligase (NAD+)
VGDTVMVRRAGDVIPEVVQVLLDKRPRGAKPFAMPLKCPSCGEKVMQPEGEVVLRCLNSVCPAKMKEGLKHFAARRAMNIEKLGDKILEQMYERGLVHTFSDLYRLKLEDILSLERQGAKSAENILSSIEHSRKTTLARFIFALGIRLVGEQTARSLAQAFGSIDGLLAATQEQLDQVEDIGPRTAELIYMTIHQASFRKEVRRLLQNGVEIAAPKTVRTDGALTGKSIVITGTLPLERDTIKDMIIAHGGKAGSSVSKKTDYVLAGEAAGSKLERARELEVAILDWPQFLKLIGKK